MSDYRPLAYPELAEQWKQHLPEIWALSLLYDLTSEDADGNFTRAYTEEQSKWMENNPLVGDSTRINNIIEALPELADYSLAHIEELPLSIYDRYRLAPGLETIPEGIEKMKVMAYEQGYPKDTFAKKDWEEYVGAMTAYHDNLKEWANKGDEYQNQPGMEKIRDLGDWLKRLPDIAEEKDGVIHLKEFMPFAYAEEENDFGQQGGFGGIFLGSEFPRGKRLQRTMPIEKAQAKELSPFEQTMKEQASIAHDASQKIAKQLLREKEADPKFAAYQEHLNRKKLGFWEGFIPNDYWFDTIFGLVPSIVGLGAGTIAGGATLFATKNAPLSAVVGYGTTMAFLNPLEATGEYQEAYDYAMKTYGDKDLARTIAANATATYLAIMNATETLPTMRYMKMIMPRAMRRASQKGFNKSIYKKILGTDGTDGLLPWQRIGGTTGKRASFHVMNAVKQAGLESTQEFMQYLGSVATKTGYRDENFSDLINWQEAQESLLGGLLMGGGIGALYSAVGGKKAYKLAQAKMFAQEITDYGRIRPQDIKDIAFMGYGEAGLPEGEVAGPGKKPPYKGPALLPKPVGEEAADVPSVKIEKPTLKGYLREILSPGKAVKSLVNQEDIEDKNLKTFVGRLSKYGPGKQIEKLAEVLKYGGKKFVKKLDSVTRKEVNAVLKGGVGNISKDVLDVVKNPDNLINDFATGKLQLDVKTGVTGKVAIKGAQRKISVRDKGYIASLLQEHDKEIIKSIEDPSPASIANYLRENAGVDISKAALSEAFEKEIERKISEPKIITGKFAAEAFKKWADQNFKLLKDKDILTPKGKVDRIESGISAAIVNKDSKYFQQVGEVVKHDKKNERVKMRMPDGTLKNMKVKDIALTPEAAKSMGVSIAEPEVVEPTVPKKDDWVVKEGTGKRKGQVSKTIQGTNPNTGESLELRLSFNKEGVLRNVQVRDPIDRLGFSPEIGRFFEDSRKLEVGDDPSVVLERIDNVFIPTVKKPVTPPKKKPDKKVKKVEQEVEEIIRLRDESVKIAKESGAAFRSGKESEYSIEEQAQAALTQQSVIPSMLQNKELVEQLKSRGLWDQFKEFAKEEKKPPKEEGPGANARYDAIGKEYDDNTPVATKQFIAKALKEIMGPHAPNIKKVFVDEIVSNPNAIGSYTSGILHFILGQATERTAYHEPIHWFMNRILSDKEYNYLYNHFLKDTPEATEEAMVEAAVEYYENSKTFKGKVLNILRKMWTAIKNFFDLNVTAEETVMDLFWRIGRDFKIKTDKDHFDKMGVTVSPATEVTTVTRNLTDVLEEIYKIPKSDYNPRQATLSRWDPLEFPVAIASSKTLRSESPSEYAHQALLNLTFKYGFSEKLKGMGNRISLGQDFPTQGLSKYEKAAVDNFYKGIQDAEWTEGKKSVETDVLIKSYEEYIEDQFPLTAYFIRNQGENVGLKGKVLPQLYSSFLRTGYMTKKFMDNIYSERILFTTKDFYPNQAHEFLLDPPDIKLDVQMREKLAYKDYSGEEGKLVAGLGFYTFVIQPVKSKTISGKISSSYEYQRDIDDTVALRPSDQQSSELRIRGVSASQQLAIERGEITPSYVAELSAVKIAKKFAEKRVQMTALFTGESPILTLVRFPTLYKGEDVGIRTPPEQMVYRFEDPKDDSITYGGGLEMNAYFNHQSEFISQDGSPRQLTSDAELAIENMLKAVLEDIRVANVLTEDSFTVRTRHLMALRWKSRLMWDIMYQMKDYISKGNTDIVGWLEDFIKKGKNELERKIPSRLAKGERKRMVIRGQVFDLDVNTINPNLREWNLPDNPSERISKISYYLRRTGYSKKLVDGIKNQLKRYDIQTADYLKTKTLRTTISDAAAGLVETPATSLKISRVDDAYQRSISSRFAKEMYNVIEGLQSILDTMFPLRLDDPSEMGKEKPRIKYIQKIMGSNIHAVKSKRFKGERSLERDKRIVKNTKEKIKLWKHDGHRGLLRAAKHKIDMGNRLIKGVMEKGYGKQIQKYEEAYYDLLVRHKEGKEFADVDIIRNELRKNRRIQIYETLTRAQKHGMSHHAFLGAVAHNLVEGQDMFKSTARIYLNEYELNDPTRVKTYEEYNLKKVGGGGNLAWVDYVFGLGEGNHLLTDDILKGTMREQFILKNSKISIPSGQLEIKTSPEFVEGRLADLNDDAPWQEVKYFLSTKHGSRAISEKEALELFRDPPRLGAVWTDISAVLKDLGLEHEYKSFKEFGAPVALVKIPADLDIRIPRFHEKRISRTKAQGRRYSYKNDGENIEELLRLRGKSFPADKRESLRYYMSRAITELIKGLNEISNITQKGMVTPTGNLWDESAYAKAKVHFENAYKSLRKAYRITLQDFVPAMFKAMKQIPLEFRDRGREYLMRWAGEIDPDIHTKLDGENKVLNIIDRMGLAGRRKARITRELVDSGTIDRILNDIDDRSDSDSHDITNEGLEITDSSDPEEIANDFTFEGYDLRNDQFFKFLERSDEKGWLDKEQTAALMDVTVSGDKDALFAHLLGEYDFVPETVEERNMVQSFWVKNQTINRTTGIDKPAWWWANLDENGVKVRNKKAKRLIPKIGGSSRFGKDIRTNRDLPRTYPMSFVDWDFANYGYQGEPIKLSRIYLKDLIDVWIGERDENGSKYYGKQEWIDLSGELMRRWDKQFANSGEKDANGVPIIRTIVEIKGGGNNPSFIVARVPSEIVGLAKDMKAVSDWFDLEVDMGNMSREMADDLVDSISEESNTDGGNNKYSAIQHITMHEVMKRAHGSDYLMRTPDVLHHMRRAALPYGEGTVPIGLGNRTVKVIDQSRVHIEDERGRRTPMTEYIAGLEGRSRSDGATLTDQETLDAIATSVGREPIQGGIPMREVKTVVWFNSKNDDFSKEHYPKRFETDTEYGGDWEGGHYLALKHNEFIPDEGMRFVDDSDNIIAYTVRENGMIRIYDGDNNRINRLSTLDEAKEPDGGSGSFKLDGRPATDTLMLPEESTRVIKVPGQRAKSSAAFPWSWMSKLYHSDFDALRNAIEERMLNVARANVGAMFDARKNPEVMASLMGQMKSDNLSFMNEVDLLIEPEPGNMISDGFMFPHLVKGFLEPVKNRLIKENSYRGRRRGLGNYPVIKPDFDGSKVSDYNGMAVSEDDFTTMQFLKDKLNLDASLFGDDLQDAFKRAVVEMNARRTGIYLFAGRFPVYSPNGVTLIKVTNIIPAGHGNVVWFHPEMLSGPLQGDADGDNSFIHMMYFGPTYKDETVVNLMKKSQDAFDKRKGYARVEYFKKKKRNLKSTHKKDMYIAGGMLGAGINAQGVFTNAITFFEDMDYKGIKIKIGNQTIVTRNPDTDRIIMEYAPLRDDVTQEMLDEANMGKLSNKEGKEWSGGEKYLLTSPAIAFRLLLQASVDHAAELLLADWGYNGYDFIMPKIFIQDNGAPIGTKQSRTISSLLRKMLTYGNLRHGRNPDTRRTQSISAMFSDSEQMHKLNQMSGKKRGKKLRAVANKRRLRFGDKSKLVKSTLPIKSLVFNNNLTSLEKLIATPFQVMNEYQKENPNDKVVEHPWGYGKNKIVNAIADTRQELMEIQKTTERWYPEDKSWNEKKDEARRFINEAADEFYRIHGRAVMHDNALESTLTAASYPYSEELLDWMDNWYNVGNKKMGIKAFKDLDEQQQAYATLRFLRGIVRQRQQIIKGVEKKAQRIINKMVNVEDKIKNEVDLGLVERLKKQHKQLRKTLDNITTITTIENQPRLRSVESMLPRHLMHPGVWREYIQRFGPNLRKASEEARRYRMSVRRGKDKVALDDILKRGCPE